MPFVRNVMTRTPSAILRTETVRAAVAIMIERDIRQLPVVDEQRRFIGMVTNRELREANGSVDLEATVATVVGSKPLAVKPDDDLAEALAIMLDHRLGAIAVTDANQKLVGVVSYQDALRAYHHVGSWA